MISSYNWIVFGQVSATDTVAYRHMLLQAVDSQNIESTPFHCLPGTKLCRELTSIIRQPRIISGQMKIKNRPGLANSMTAPEAKLREEVAFWKGLIERWGSQVEREELLRMGDALAYAQLKLARYLSSTGADQDYSHSNTQPYN